MLKAMVPPVPVIDFRRQSMVLQWNAVSGAWAPYDVPPMLVHGVALIRAAQPNICLFARNARLHLQIDADQYELADESPRIRWRHALVGLRRRFTLESSGGAILFSHGYWSSSGDDFFSWLATRSADPAWRRTAGQRWSEGVEPAVLRSS